MVLVDWRLLSFEHGSPPHKDQFCSSIIERFCQKLSSIDPEGLDDSFRCYPEAVEQALVGRLPSDQKIHGFFNMLLESPPISRCRRWSASRATIESKKHLWETRYRCKPPPPRIFENKVIWSNCFVMLKWSIKWIPTEVSTAAQSSRNNHLKFVGRTNSLHTLPIHPRETAHFWCRAG